MANIRREFGDDLTLKNGSLGINTTTAQERVDVVGVVKGRDLNVTGVSSLTAYEGFLRADNQIDESINLEFGNGLKASLSGEIIVGTGVTVTIGAVGLGTTTVGVGTTTAANGKTASNLDTTDVNLAGGSQVECLKVFNTFTPPSGGTNERPYAPKPGELYYNYDFKTIEFHDGYGWRQVDNTTRSGRGVYGGGENPGISSRIDYLNLTSGGNALNFGDLTDERFQLAGASSSIRGLFAGGDPGPSNSDVIEYVTIASAGNGIDFGNLITAGRLSAAASSSTRAIFAGENKVNVISYVEINTTGNAVDFGDLTNVSGDKATATSSPTRFVVASGNSSNPQIIEYGTIASKGNTVTFGDLTYGGSGFRMPRATSNGIRGIFTGGYQTASPNAGLKRICYITMATTGNATDFGDLTGTRQRQNCMSSQTKSIQAGGQSDASGSGDDLLTIEAIDYASGGNAIDFGDTNGVTANGAGLSDSHGGLGGF